MTFEELNSVKEVQIKLRELLRKQYSLTLELTRQTSVWNSQPKGEPVRRDEKIAEMIDLDSLIDETYVELAQARISLTEKIRRDFDDPIERKYLLWRFVLNRGEMFIKKSMGLNRKTLSEMKEKIFKKLDKKS